MVSMSVEHTPVLLNESLELLDIRPGGLYVDCTVGLGGHSEAILERLGGQGQLLGIDRDQAALDRARERLSRFRNVELYHSNFKNLPLILSRLSRETIDGCLIDLGVSSMQLTSAERGFSLRETGPLDMRMDPDQKITASQLLHQLNEDQLTDLFRRYGEEPSARKIAAAIVAERRVKRLQTTRDLAELVERVKGRRPGSRIHPATQVFQALRIEVNQELSGLEEFLEAVIQRLSPGGRLVVVSFHSLEDRVVKQLFQKQAGRCICFQPGDACICPRQERVRILTKKPVVPSAQEIGANPRSRSAKLRAVEKIKDEGRRMKDEG
ncbi:MAG: 16S rRNA (cytosine(1402)-N(4))-methyltransferase RsmH [Acidobacteria bacterium]|nr:MAG: 16S rRNA (cytosine(1402)-N(4))-methyltransferase RsmH [Acidobacteriota bacterium]